MISGRLGRDFEGAFAIEPEIVEDFITEAPAVEHSKPEYKVGIKPVEEGIVIDHIATGEPVEKIWSNIEAVRKILKLNVRSSHGVYHSFKGPEVYKGIISLPDIISFGEKDLKKLAAIAPGCTLNLIRNGKVAKKYRLAMPPRIYGFEEISCKNESCISNPKNNEGVTTEFRANRDPRSCAVTARRNIHSGKSGISNRRTLFCIIHEKRRGYRTLSESTWPRIGIEAMPSAFSLSRWRLPRPRSEDETGLPGSFRLASGASHIGGVCQNPFPCNRFSASARFGTKATGTQAEAPALVLAAASPRGRRVA